MSRAVFLPLFAMLTVSGCSAGSLSPGGSASGSAGGSASGSAADSRTDQATQLACRTRANEMYDRRNRAEIYSANSTINSPFSANYQPGTTNQGLAERFSFEQMVSECIRNAGTGAERPVAPAPQPTARTR